MHDSCNFIHSTVGAGNITVCPFIKQTFLATSMVIRLSANCQIQLSDMRHLPNTGTCPIGASSVGQELKQKARHRKNRLRGSYG